MNTFIKGTEVLESKIEKTIQGWLKLVPTQETFAKLTLSKEGKGVKPDFSDINNYIEIKEDGTKVIFLSMAHDSEQTSFTVTDQAQVEALLELFSARNMVYTRLSYEKEYGKARVLTGLELVNEVK